MDTDNRTRVAIACQGGGSHTAFTAGVLRRILLDLNDDYEIIGLSGTSGGAICALMAWDGLCKEECRDGARVQAAEALRAFWMDNAAELPWEAMWNLGSVWLQRMQAAGSLPQWQLSPYSPQSEWSEGLLKRVAPGFFDLPKLLERHIDFDTIGHKREVPRLLLGAVAVESGEFKAFDSAKSEICLEALLASAAVPWLFKAVEVDGVEYWDGLFSQNPPIRDFVAGKNNAEKPAEIWVVTINPQRCGATPRRIEDILDRRNELIGNLSMNQELHFIEKVNAWLTPPAKDKGDPRRPILSDADSKKLIKVRRIGMAPEKAALLDYPTKLDRSVARIEDLMSHGEDCARRVLGKALVKHSTPLGVE